MEFVNVKRVIVNALQYTKRQKLVNLTQSVILKSGTYGVQALKYALRGALAQLRMSAKSIVIHYLAPEVLISRECFISGLGRLCSNELKPAFKEVNIK